LNSCTGAAGEGLPHLWGGPWLILSHHPDSSLPEVCCYWRASGYSSLMTISASAVTALRSRGTTPTGWLMSPRDWQDLCTCPCPGRTLFSPSCSSARNKPT
jgi:hypothetical protein